MTFDEVQPYLLAVGTTSSVVTMGFILNLMQQVRATASAHLELKEERIRAIRDDMDRTTKWHETEKSKLKTELETQKARLDEILRDAGVNLTELALGRHLADTASTVRDAVNSLTTDMTEKLAKLEALVGPRDATGIDPGVRLSLAMGEMASGSYVAAAEHFESNAGSDRNWEAHFTRGVAYANARQGHDTDLSSLRAYNEAIALAPVTLTSNMRSRMFAYRGAMHKRLGRLDEALADLSIALATATNEQEKLDANYNLACVYALEKNRARLLEHLKQIQGSKRYVRAVKAHSTDYFAAYWDDPEFTAMIRS